MKKLIYLFLTVLIVACSGDGGGDGGGDDGGNNNTSSLVGTWNLTSITDVNGVPQDLEATCANENYFIAPFSKHHLCACRSRNPISDDL